MTLINSVLSTRPCLCNKQDTGWRLLSFWVATLGVSACNVMVFFDFLISIPLDMTDGTNTIHHAEESPVRLRDNENMSSPLL